jgi:conjugative relaxase-like TrwC/TraI family protein
MLRVTTIHASHAGASADYYAKYLTQAPGEVPGVWAGKQADALGLRGDVTHDDLLALLEARDPVSGTPLGRPFRDIALKDGRVKKAVAGFDATFSAPKSLSVLWALTQDERLLEAHDTAVAAALAHLDRFGSTTRIKQGADGMLHPDTGGLTIAKFRQTTSRADDPDIHTHAVISNKVRAADGGWRALDGQYLKKHQRMLGGIYQSVLRNEFTHRFGFEWEPIVNGQAEIAGIPKDVLRAFSKRTVQVEDALDEKLDDFFEREGREPSHWERAALTREAAIDTRAKKSGNGVTDLTTRWTDEASDLGWTWQDLVDEALHAAAEMSKEPRVVTITAHHVIDQLTADGSVWNRADVMKAICDLARPMPSQDGERWAASLDRACDAVIEAGVGLDPVETAGPRRKSDGRSVWVSPISRHVTSERILEEEDFVISWSMEAQAAEPMPSVTVDTNGLDVMQAEVARAVAGHDRLVLAVGPAGTGKTTTMRRAVADLHDDSRCVFGVAPSAKAAQVLKRETGVESDTLAKLLYEWERPNRDPHPEFDLPPGATVLVDEAGMVGTFALARLVGLAQLNEWRVVLIGDHHQLQAVGRGGMFHELCLTGRATELDCIHRFHEPWEAAASLQLRHGDQRGLDPYFEHDRVKAGTFDDHLRHIAKTWLDNTQDGRSVSITAATNEHVDKINAVIQQLRIANDEIGTSSSAPIDGGERAYVGDVVATRRNDRRLETTTGEPVRNRETWTVAAIGDDGSLAVSSNRGSGQVTLPVEYASEHVRLAYATTEHGVQGETVDIGIELATVATTRRGLYVAATRGRAENHVLVVTDSNDLDDARDILEYVLTTDRADVPATAQRRVLAEAEHRVVVPAHRYELRCSIPDWFDDLQSSVANDLDEAESSAAIERRRLDELGERLEGARATLASANESIEPFRFALDAADEDVRTAHRAVQAPTNQARNTKGFKRRAHLREADRAKGSLDVAQGKKNDLAAVAAPAQERVEDARREVRDVKSLISAQRVRDRWSGSEAQIEQLAGLDASLHTWKRWALGERVADADLIDVAETLSNVPDGPWTAGYSDLGEALDEWAEQHGIDLSPPIEVPTRSVSDGFGIDL